MSIAINAYIKKIEISQINNITLYLREWNPKLGQERKKKRKRRKGKGGGGGEETVRKGGKGQEKHLPFQTLFSIC